MVKSGKPHDSFDMKARYKNKLCEISTFQKHICKWIPHVQKEYFCFMSFIIWNFTKVVKLEKMVAFDFSSRG